MTVQEFGMASVVPSMYRSIWVFMVLVLLGDIVLGTDVNQKMLIQARGKRNTNNRQEQSNSVDPSMYWYTPATPSPEEVNCYVEVPVTRRVGGRCVLLGRSTWGCQAGVLLAINSECQQVTGNQVGDQATAGSANINRPGTRATNPFRRGRRRPLWQ
ncbi:hypothetical protein BsWGS_06588 [Bradybaena similaris]